MAKVKPVEGAYDNVKQKKIHDKVKKKNVTREREKEYDGLTLREMRRKHGIPPEVGGQEILDAYKADKVGTVRKEESVEENVSKRPEKTEDKEEKVTPENNIQNKAPKTAPVEERREKNKSKKFYSPLVKSIAKKEGIAFSELESVSGSGLNGRVNKNDILQYIQSRDLSTLEIEYRKPSLEEKKFGKIEEMDHVRRVIAKHMVDSVKKSPHVYSSVEVDMTNVVKFVKKSKDRYFIIDLLVADISLVVTKRSEFNSLLKKIDYNLQSFNESLENIELRFQ